MFATLRRFIRSKPSSAILIGAVAAATLALAVGGGSKAGVVLGRRTAGAGSPTSLVTADSPRSPSARTGSQSGGTVNGDPGRKSTCPPDPAPGSTIHGGLLVTGVCHLVHITVNGGVVIASTGHLELEESTVNGGVDVQPGGEFDAGHHTPFSATATFLPSTINGGIKADHVFDIDLDNATVMGTVSISGNPAGFYSICGSTLRGKVELNDVHSPVAAFPTVIGDPGETIQLGPHPDCPGNTIDGSVFVSNSTNIEIEGNTITGSVQISDSHVELAANRIGGSAHCRNAVLFTDGDHTPNVIRGSNNCP